MQVKKYKQIVNTDCDVSLALLQASVATEFLTAARADPAGTEDRAPLPATPHMVTSASAPR